MDNQLLDFTRSRWNRMLLNGFWCLLGLMIVFESLFLAYITPLPTGDFFNRYMLLPTFLHLVLLSITELAIRFVPDRLRDYLLLVVCAILTFIIVVINIEVSYLIPCLFLPVLVSIFYFSLKKLIAASIFCLLSSFYPVFSEQQ